MAISMNRTTEASVSVSAAKATGYESIAQVAWLIRILEAEWGPAGTDLLAEIWKKRYILRLQWHLIAVFGFVQLQ